MKFSIQSNKAHIIDIYKTLIPTAKNLSCFTKSELIKKINTKILEKLSLTQLKQLFRIYKINIIQKYNNKKYLQNKLKYIILKNIKYNNILYKFYYELIYYSKKNFDTKQIKTFKSNNESFGISCEYVLCNLYNLDNNLHNRVNHEITDNLTILLNQFKTEFEQKYKLSCVEFIGAKNNHIDFKCNNNQTLSVKSNINNNNLCCPQNIGQCTFKSFVHKIQKNYYFKSQTLNLKSKYHIKKFIINNITKLFNIYFNNLFTCNYLLWIRENKNLINYNIIKKPKKLNLNPALFHFTKNIKTWNESNTLKYNNMTIGVFQIHNNRNCIKFRFNLDNVLKLIMNK
jgi:hypothetical protein